MASPTITIGSSPMRLLRCVSLIVLCNGFQLSHLPITGKRHTASILLAKRQKESTKKAGSGFGAPLDSKPSRSRTQKGKQNSDSGDFAVFPALQDEVQATMIPSTPDLSITEEVFDRLDQIYGFPTFNQRSEESDASAMSLGDLLSTDIDTTSTVLQQTISNLPEFESIRVLHMDPLVLTIDNFLTEEECDRYIELSRSADTVQTKSPTVGKDSVAKAQRTSTTFYHLYEAVPELLSKAARLLGLEQLDHLEEVQTVRYQRNQRFTWHLDALGPQDLADSGQRVATLLVYLTDLTETDGGATLFRDLKNGANDPKESKYLTVRPTKGSALLFFPAAGGIPGTPMDVRTLHCGQAVSSESTKDKWIAQVWLREKPYRPTSPPGNSHTKALKVVVDYCSKR